MILLDKKVKFAKILFCLYLERRGRSFEQIENIETVFIYLNIFSD